MKHAHGVFAENEKSKGQGHQLDMVGSFSMTVKTGFKRMKEVLFLEHVNFEVPITPVV